MGFEEGSIPYNRGVPTVPRSRPAVLLVEDDASTRNLYRDALKSASLSVIAAADGLEALRRLESGRPSVIVLDLGLPVLDGRDIARELAARSDTAQIPIVVVTGREHVNLRQGDAAAVLRKPVDPHDLVSAVMLCLRTQSS
jgi:DNA-binding response OmpR family regulator